jgi:hypothetical protein
MIHSSKFYAAKYQKYTAEYNKLHKVYGHNMAKKYTYEAFKSAYKKNDIDGKRSNVLEEARGAIYTTRKQGFNLNNRFKEGIRLARAKEARGETLTELEQKLADTNISDINVKDIRANKGAAKGILDLLDTDKA